MVFILIEAPEGGSSNGWPRTAASPTDWEAAVDAAPNGARADKTGRSEPRHLRSKRSREPLGGPPGLGWVHHERPDAQSDRDRLGDGEYGNQHSANLRSFDGFRYRDKTLAIPWHGAGFRVAGRRSRWLPAKPGNAARHRQGRIGRIDARLGCGETQHLSSAGRGQIKRPAEPRGGALGTARVPGCCGRTASQAGCGLAQRGGFIHEVLPDAEKSEGPLGGHDLEAIEIAPGMIQVRF